MTARRQLEAVSSGTQAENAASSLSVRLESVISRLRRLPAKAGREGEHSPSVWTTFGECLSDLDEITKELP